jgi:serine/threonine-protein kinase
MGAVDLIWDRRLGRAVALKTMHPERTTRAELLARFEREARIQGQLEHPGVVPVYELGMRADGSIYFTMKRVRGHTLEQVIVGLAAGEELVTREYGLRRLLSAFVTVCLTIEFVHRRGVLHRDLKPANVILGDFGEVHVIDWGIARLIDAGAGAGDGEGERRSETIIDTGEVAGATLAGALVGTPGYMAPEQVRGAPVDARSDVYALGSILFEILALEPLHPASGVPAQIASTVHGLADPRPSRRARRDVGPELDAICERALALDPNDRFPSARELAQAVEAHLDGVQDTAKRVALAAEHVTKARAALARARSDPERAIEERGAAIRELSAAVSLNPKAREPLELLARTAAEVPTQLPRAADAALGEHRAAQRRQAARNGMRALMTLLALVPVLSFIAAGGFLGLMPLFVLLAAYTAWMWWVSRQKRMTRFEAIVSALLGAAVAGVLSEFGPFALVPTAVLGIGVIIIVHSKADRLSRRVVMLIGVLAVLAPYALGYFGVLADRYVFSLREMTGVAVHAGSERVFNLLLVVIGGIAAVVTPMAILGRTLDQLLEAERRLFGQAWQLERLIDRPDDRQP